MDRSGNVFAVGFAWADAEETNGPIVFRDAAPGYKIMPYPEAIEGSVLVKFGPQGKSLWARGIPPYLDYFDPSLTFGDGSILLFIEGSESQLDFGGGISVERRLSYIARFSIPASGSAEKPAVSADRIAVCVDDRVRLRSAGNLEGATLGYLAKGDRVVVLERSGEKTKVGEMLDFWYRVRRLSDGLVGCCYGYYLRME